MALWTALLAGLIGSLHCVGMCGPIALALPGQSRGWQRMLPGRVLYNLGRVVTYSFLGLLMGAFGRGLSIAGWQQGLSVALGGLLVLLALSQIQLESRVLRLPAVDKGLFWLRKQLGTWMKDGRPHSLFQVGLLNGLLPCGFVYLALAGALSVGGMWEASLYMALFGLGTFPAMLVMSMAGQWLHRRLKRGFQPILTGFTVVFGLLLILRGLNLGIPYLSPDLSGVEPGCE